MAVKRIWLFLWIIPLAVAGRENPFDTIHLTSPSAEMKKPSAEAPRKIIETKPERINTSVGSFLIDNNKIVIETKDPLLKHFSLEESRKIVLDFEGYADFATKHIETRSSRFTNLTIGVHENYYRIVITMSEQREYRIVKEKYGYRLTLQ